MGEHGIHEACNVLEIEFPHLHSSLRKEFDGKGNAVFQGCRTESFVDDYPCSKKEECNLEHVYNSIELFTSMLQYYSK